MCASAEEAAGWPEKQRGHADTVTAAYVQRSYVTFRISDSLVAPPSSAAASTSPPRPATMSTTALSRALPTALKEVRLHLCQSSQASAGTRWVGGANEHRAKAAAGFLGTRIYRHADRAIGSYLITGNSCNRHTSLSSSPIPICLFLFAKPSAHQHASLPDLVSML